MISVNHDEYTARQTGHPIACDCEMCCAVRTEAVRAEPFTITTTITAPTPIPTTR